MHEVTGSVSAEFTAFEGETQLRRHVQSYPLKIAKTFKFDGFQLGVYVMDASPGMMTGDHYELNYRFGEGTNVFITNQSYTKVHPARKNEAEPAVPSRQRQSLHLGTGAYVEYMPEPLMLYKEAYFLGETEVRMEGDAALIWSDIVCPGRTHRGELFQYERYQNRMTVWYDDEMIFCAKQRVEPNGQSPIQIGRWDAYTHLGNLYFFSRKVDAVLLESLRERLEAVAPSNSALFFGISLTYKHGLTVSVLGCRVYEITELLEAAWYFIRDHVFQKPPLHVPK